MIKNVNFKNILFIFILVIFTFPKTLKAQSPELDDSFDPFSDYNEFEQEADEEADINFLKNGRYLSLALLSGYRGFTGGLHTVYNGGSLDYGVQFNYFFNLSTALTFGYTTGDSAVNFYTHANNSSVVADNYAGTVNIQIFDLQAKYYVNTDNVTKGLADLNPYALIGVGFFTRTYSFDQSFATDPDRVFGLRLGGGIEIPFSKRDYYIGVQALYSYVTFPDENRTLFSPTDSTTDQLPVNSSFAGDMYEINLILGTNF